MRSILFVPGDDPKKMEKAVASPADALIFDLEDSVSPTNKAAARKVTAERLLSPRPDGQSWWVRINGLSIEDLVAVLPAKPDGIVLPKCTGPADIDRLSHWLEALETHHGLAQSSTGIIAIVTETAQSVLMLSRYADYRSARLKGLMWGVEDLSADIGGNGRGVAGLVRNLCLLAATACGVAAIDTVYTRIKDLEDLEREAREAAKDGFLTKAAIHPGQIETINRAFSPSEAEIAWAQKVIALLENNAAGVANLDGMMIDAPHRHRAENILARHSSLR